MQPAAARRAALTALGALGALAFASGCGDGSAPITPKTLEVTAGDNQTGPSGGALAAPLVVLVTGSDGRPMQGVTVGWTVTSGVATATPAAPTTDAAGVARATVSLGAIGAVEIRATVAGLAPAVFYATSVDPCTYLVPHTLGGTSTGALSSADCDFGDGSFIDFYGLTLASQQAIRLTMTAGFNAYLWLYSITGRVLSLDDDGAGGNSTNSAMKVLLPSGQYVIGANSLQPDEKGPYTMTSAATSSDVDGCEQVWVVRGITTQQIIKPTDCVDNSGPYYLDGFVLVLYSGQGVILTEQSAAFAARLQLYNGAGTLLTEATAGAPGGTAQITYTSTSTAVYVIFAGTTATSTQGAYTLSVTTPSAMAVAPAPTPLPRFSSPALAKSRREWPAIAPPRAAGRP